MTVAVTSGDPSGIGPEIVQKSWVSLKNDPSNHLMNYAMASNISGVIGSAVAAGVLISYFS